MSVFNPVYENNFDYLIKLVESLNAVYCLFVHYENIKVFFSISGRSFDLKYVIRQMLDHDPNSRPSVDQLLAFPCIRKVGMIIKSAIVFMKI